MKYHTRLTYLIITSLLVASLSGCAQNEPKQSSEDILTQNVVDKDKLQITVLVKPAFFINSYEKIIEKKFPKVDLIQVGNYTSDMGIEEYKARLKNDDLTDIIMTWPLDVGKEYWEERLLDLSSLPLTSNYNQERLENISENGNLYYLPGPSQLRGIIYNKTMFEEKGWQVPTDFESFISLCHTIEASGTRSLQLGLKNSEVLDTAFVGYGYDECFSKPKDVSWRKNYDEGKGKFFDQYEPALATFQRLIDEGILKETDLDVDYAKREELFFNRKTAMIEDSVLLTRLGKDYNGTEDEFAMMPFFNPGEANDWARLYPVCFIGLNKHLAQKENKDKYNMIMKIMEYTSTIEGQQALMGDTEAMISGLNDVPAPNTPEISGMIDTLNLGKYAIFPTFKRSQEALRIGLSEMIQGSKTGEQVAKQVDEANASTPLTLAPKKIGEASEDFTLIDTGNFICDTMREKAKSDFALFLDDGKDGRYNGKGVSARLYKGKITNIDIKRILPDLKYDEKGELLKITMSGKDLITTLEESIKVRKDIGGWFYYFSGLKMTYDVSDKPGNRIHKIRDDKGNKINMDKIYSIAVMDMSVPEDFILSSKKENITISDLLIQKIKTSKTITPSKDHRFNIYHKK
ncbi:MAG: extracellular solute-binding protein [Erysipelotrichaceae bacterium]